MTGMRHVYWCTWWSVLPLKHIFFAAQDMEVAVFRSKWDLGSSNIIWLAEVPGIARVIIRLSAILPTSSLENSSTRVLRSICASRSAHTSRSTRSWSCLNSKLVLPQLEAGLASTRSWSCLDLKLISPSKLICASCSTQNWSCLDSKLISPSKLISHLTLTMHCGPKLHPFCSYFWNWLIWTLFTPSLLPRSVIVTSHMSTGRASVWLAGLPGSVSTPTDLLSPSPAIDSSGQS